MGLRKKFQERREKAKERRARERAEHNAAVETQVDGVAKALQQDIDQHRSAADPVFYYRISGIENYSYVSAEIGKTQCNMRQFPGYQTLHDICAAEDVKISEVIEKVGPELAGPFFRGFIKIDLAERYVGSMDAKFYTAQRNKKNTPPVPGP